MWNCCEIAVPHPPHHPNLLITCRVVLSGYNVDNILEIGGWRTWSPLPGDWFWLWFVSRSDVKLMWNWMWIRCDWCPFHSALVPWTFCKSNPTCSFPMPAQSSACSFPMPASSAWCPEPGAWPVSGAQSRVLAWRNLPLLHNTQWDCEPDVNVNVKSNVKSLWNWMWVKLMWSRCKIYLKSMWNCGAQTPPTSLSPAGWSYQVSY